MRKKTSWPFFCSSAYFLSNESKSSSQEFSSWPCVYKDFNTWTLSGYISVHSAKAVNMVFKWKRSGSPSWSKSERSWHEMIYETNTMYCSRLINTIVGTVPAKFNWALRYVSCSVSNSWVEIFLQCNCSLTWVSQNRRAQVRQNFTVLSFLWKQRSHVISSGPVEAART